MKKNLFFALAALSFAACDKSNEFDSPVHNGEVEESYIAINLMSADKGGTRAATDTYGYEEGTAAERAIKTAYFFFFDENGAAFNVTQSAPGGEKNHLQLTISDLSTSGMPNVSDIKDAVLILSTYKGVYPSKIVAVLNWTPDDKPYTLNELHGVVNNSLGNDNDGYVMSNSVYVDGANKVVDATPLTAANIKKSANEALTAPVNIYVERTAAKVVLTASGKGENSDNIFNTQKSSTLVTLHGGTSTIDVYVKLHGWELYNDYSTTSLLKNIDAKWDISTLGLTWNDIPYYRCYWAESQNTPHNDNFAWEYNASEQATRGFLTAYGFNVASNTNYTDRTTYTFCGENTNQVVNTGGVITSDPRTKVILKGQLMKKTGENYEPLALARWYGTEYAGEHALRTAVANSLQHTLFFYDEVTHTYTSIYPDDIECVIGTTGAEAYEVGFRLSTPGQAKTWYQYSSESGYQMKGSTETNITETNSYLATVEPALVYANGQTYYYIDIEHLGTAGAKYGVIRNHVYQIDIKSIKGYGSPVFSGFSNIVTPPVYPEDGESSYVAARINVLSWKVVKQGVDIQP